MLVRETSLCGVYVLEPKAYSDHRGFFMESFHKDRLHALGLPYEYVQDNHSLSVESGTVRGLHYQLEPHAQTKLIRVLRGAIWDVAVDIRPESPQCGQWAGVILSESNRRQLLIPKGYAHGFCTLAANTEVLYKVDSYYSPEHDRGIRWDDPELNIDWPTREAVLSDKDRQLPFWSETDVSRDRTRRKTGD
ncbi:dTDP-4-dehydrorhamnose 3,5-epimerase [Paenibacillus marinisediminis]